MYEDFYGLNFDAITIEDCIELYEKFEGSVIINDGCIVTVIRGGW